MTTMNKMQLNYCEAMNMKKPMFQVWSCGGGTQSCAIAVLIIQGKLPKPDCAVIADTGYETQRTWDYMEKWLVPNLAKVGVTLHKVKASEYSYSPYIIHKPRAGSKNEFLHNLPVFTLRDGVKAKLRNYCTSKWKIEVIGRYIKKNFNKTRKDSTHWIGFSFDEQRRWVKASLSDEYKRGLISFPLVDLRITRQQAIKIVEDYGWPTPPRSACYLCPNHSDAEWRLLKDERPDEFAMAVEIEKELQKYDPEAWLHSSCKPLDQVIFSQPEDMFSRPCDSGLCFV